MESITDEWLALNGHDQEWLNRWLDEPILNEEAVKEWFRVHRDSDPKLLVVYHLDVCDSEPCKEVFLRRRSRPWMRSYIRRRKARRATPFPLSSKQKDDRIALFDNQCAYCGDNKKITVDHVVPLSKSGLDAANNIVPACTCCNSSKCAKPVEEWYKAQDFFDETRWLKIQKYCGLGLTPLDCVIP